ncbi:MAG: hypothetical protein C0473_01605 [Cyanobacteria bacterium DS3.002]|nr:hypothetical protein [Cyanobacteria bacterium DS3.002]
MSDHLPLITYLCAMLPSVIVGTGAIYAGLSKGLWLWPTNRLLFPSEDLAPALRIYSLSPSSEQPTVSIDCGRPWKLVLAQVIIYIVCAAWANVLAAMIFLSQPCISLLLSPLRELKAAGIIYGLILTSVTSLFAFYKLQVFFYQKIASGSLGRKDYINQLRFNCCIFAGALGLLVPLIQSFLLSRVGLALDPVDFLRIGWLLSVAPLALVQLIILLHSNPHRHGNYLDLMRFWRALRPLQKQDSPLIESLQKYSDIELIGFAEIARFEENSETMEIIERILNERYEKQH